MSEPEQVDRFAVLNAVLEVFDKHLTSSRWKVSENPDDPDDDEANGWVGPARTALAEVIKSSVQIRRGSDPASVERDFEDFRDYVLWQYMVEFARAQDGVECKWRDCDCDCHSGKDAG